jgi:GAF domain-containing protein
MTHATIPQSNRELNVLINFSQKIIRTLDLQQVLQVISDGMSELLEIETAAIYLLENDKELLLGATTPPLPPGMPNELLRASLEDHPNIKTVIKGRKSKVIADTSNAKLTKAEKNIVEIRRLRSLLFLPFVQEEDVLGVLILGTCNKSRKYTKHEVSLGQTIANQFSVAILNSKLHDDLKKHKENLEMLVQEKTNDLNAAIEELKATNDELFYKNEIINNQNIELKATLNT